MNRLPYPHARNDCEVCREHDADFQLQGGDHDPTSTRAERYCRRCLDEKLLWTAQYGAGRSPEDPLTVTVVLLRLTSATRR
jgi:hypothetical protein